MKHFHEFRPSDTCRTESRNLRIKGHPPVSSWNRSGGAVGQDPSVRTDKYEFHHLFPPFNLERAKIVGKKRPLTSWNNGYIAEARAQRYKHRKDCNKSEIHKEPDSPPITRNKAHPSIYSLDRLEIQSLNVQQIKRQQCFDIYDSRNAKARYIFHIFGEVGEPSLCKEALGDCRWQRRKCTYGQFGCGIMHNCETSVSYIHPGIQNRVSQHISSITYRPLFISLNITGSIGPDDSSNRNVNRHTFYASKLLVPA
jgi:hypothetical protein